MEKIKRFEDFENPENCTLDNPYEMELSGRIGGKYWIWRDSFGDFHGTNDLENARARVSDARRISDFKKSDGFRTLDDVVEYVGKYF